MSLSVFIFLTSVIIYNNRSQFIIMNDFLIYFQHCFFYRIYINKNKVFIILLRWIKSKSKMTISISHLTNLIIMNSISQDKNQNKSLTKILRLLPKSRMNTKNSCNKWKTSAFQTTKKMKAWMASITSQVCSEVSWPSWAVKADFKEYFFFLNLGLKLNRQRFRRNV